MEINYIKINTKPKYPDSMYYTLLFKKEGKLVAVGMIDKVIKYIPIDKYENKYKNFFLSLMETYLTHCIEKGKKSIEYDTVEESYTEIKEFRKNPFTVDVYFVDIDAMDVYEEEELEASIRNIIHKYMDYTGDYSTLDREARDLGNKRKTGSYLSNGHGAYTIKRKDEQQWIDSLFKNQ